MRENTIELQGDLRATASALSPASRLHRQGLVREKKNAAEASAPAALTGTAPTVVRSSVDKTASDPAAAGRV